jgi:hypothetical protein
MAMDFEKDLKVKPFLSQARKIGGRVVYEELIPPTFDEDEALDGLLEGVSQHDIETGRERLLSENPSLASQGIHDLFEIDADDRAAAAEYTNPVREASVKRAGKLALKDSGDSISFRRVNGGRNVELAADDGAILESLSSLEFNTLLESGDYIVL